MAFAMRNCASGAFDYFNRNSNSLNIKDVIEINELRRENAELERLRIKNLIDSKDKEIERLSHFIFQCCDVLEPFYSENHTLHEAQEFLKVKLLEIRK